ncbi:TPA: hypothetical protein QCV86_005639 [Bacillus thuringiensis]|nr:hypothetical protein [Bacillus cereus]HDR6828672.1 hypothetical protein [Bacillus thuringiensis]HDR6835043.1 hypothetical protein [Bacillus thuringiensis]HDR6860757.1 hypothetical protein [Bacillus thuringiensis]HDR6905803.1 hypothetical protein [Bacillus thuringiensis]
MSRANVSWKIKDIKDEEARSKINKWCDQQEKIQVSLTSLVLHMIDRFGYKNITDHDIQKLLHQEFPLTSITKEESISEPIEKTEGTPDNITKQTNNIITSPKTIEEAKKNPVPKEVQSSSEDDIYAQVDKNAF